METINLTVYSYIVLGLIGVVVLLACWVVYLQLSLQQIRKTLFSISDNFNEIDSVINTVKGFSKRWDYVTKAEELERKLEEVQMMDPESKMYNRAVKMVKAGSSIEEVMEECELPRSEAQLLFSIHRN